MTLRVSVVIPTYKRPQLLLRCLEALVDQSFEPTAYEVIVVDDGQTDDTEAAVAQIAELTRGSPEIRYLRPEGTRGPAAARNRGWRAAESPVIAFTDDDTIPDRDWLRYGMLAMTMDRAAAWGRVVVPISDHPTDHEKNTRGLEDAEFVTANAFVRRDALEAVGGFDERFKRAWREDADLYFSLLQRFGTVDPVPAALVIHPVRPARWGISLSQQANMFFDALLYKKHPRHYRELIRRLPPWRYYLIVSCAIGALIAGLGGSPVLAMLLAMVALGFIGAFAWQRLRHTSHEPRHVAEMVVTSVAIPFLSVFWRIAGAVRFRVPFI
ncbi:glycosyltransferase family 2 protein [Aquabacterium sp. A7-Y]|uniref:glycosyltransferase family 2 protein n=1 Tax=Aquabacterium sp. A7-Y TaxID=1349605 RepID=UPI00223DA33C|nr:glycosyltransferase [Aquabacterium sp. A7-Y]MCW7536315.1 glycosyltransferase family 2 protein [Aquabacterium sp. A7-Y]